MVGYLIENAIAKIITKFLSEHVGDAVMFENNK